MPTCKICNEEKLLILRATQTCTSCNNAMNESKVRGPRVQSLDLSGCGYDPQHIKVTGRGAKTAVEFIQTQPSGAVVKSCELSFDTLDLIYGLTFEMNDEQLKQLKAHLYGEEERRSKEGE